MSLPIFIHFAVTEGINFLLHLHTAFIGSAIAGDVIRKRRARTRVLCTTHASGSPDNIISSRFMYVHLLRVSNNLSCEVDRTFFFGQLLSSKHVHKV